MVLLVVLMAAAAFALQYSGEKSVTEPAIEQDASVKPSELGPDLHKAVFKVDNMSCSGCIATIEGSLSGFQGIEDVFVDLGSGRAEIIYREGQGGDAKKMAQAITQSGYPAKVLMVLSPEEIKKERALAASKAKYCVASVNGYDIARADFDMEMNAARKKYREEYGKDLFKTPRGKSLEARLQGQILSSLIEQGTLLKQIDRSGFVVDDGVQKAELAAYIRKNGNDEKALQKAVMEAGYSYDYFKKRFENGVLINRFIEEKVVAEGATPVEKQQAFARWFNNAKAQTNVAYYDKDLERAARQQTAAGSCCAVR